MEPGSTPNHGSRMGPRKGLMAALGTRTAPAHGRAKCHAGAGLWSFKTPAWYSANGRRTELYFETARLG
jgi:hypothetical protein